jgi:hypothetical protein
MTECSSGQMRSAHGVSVLKKQRGLPKTVVRADRSSVRHYYFYFEPVRRSAGFG